jgi:superfamily II DNA or RNA helicase
MSVLADRKMDNVGTPACCERGRNVMRDWAGPGEGYSWLVSEMAARCLAVYREAPLRVEEDAQQEVAAAEGGYGRKQIHELVQNGADVMIGSAGRIEVILTPGCLYVANAGAPFSEKGVETLLSSHLSRKRGDEIGRFGLGFKSVTAMSSSPQVFSRTVSFGFDRHRSVRLIQEVVPTAQKVPLLRLAEVIDPRPWAESDDVLADLMRWASTVVRLPLDDAEAAITDDMKRFPATFLLFARHVSELVLDDRISGTRREVRASDSADGAVILAQDGETSRWRIFSRAHEPSRAALDDAGERARRDRILLTWAVPVTGQQRGVGEFSAYFPIDEQTTLAGIINAPWKMSDDRRTLLEGRFNEEILTVALPSLVADALPQLVDPAHPEEVLEYLPARGKEPRGWADDVLNKPVYERLSSTPSLPGLDGRLHEPATMKLHPQGLVGRWLDRWAEIMGPAGDWVHHGVDRSPTYRSKAERLLRAGGRTVPLEEWLETPARDRGSAGSAVAMLVASEVQDSREDPLLAAAAKRAHVARREDGELVRLEAGRIFLRSDSGDRRKIFLDPEVRAYPGVEAMLRRRNIGHLDAAGRLRKALIEQSSRGVVDWSTIWPLTSAVPDEEIIRIIRDCVTAPFETNVKVRTAAGSWKSLDQVLLPGPIIPASVRRDADFVVAADYHGHQLDLLAELGAVDRPRALIGKPEERWFTLYKEAITENYVESQQNSRLQADKLVLPDRAPLWPLGMLPALSPEARLEMTRSILYFASGDRWTVEHRSRAYAAQNYVAPEYWWARKHGVLDTPLGPWDISACLHPNSDAPEWFPKPEITGTQANRLKLTKSVEELTAAQWAALIGAVEEGGDEKRLWSTYAWAAAQIPRPVTLRATVGTRLEAVPSDKVAVASREEAYRSLCQLSQPVILAVEEEDHAILVEYWDLADGDDAVHTVLEWAPVGEATLLIDLFPPIQNFLDQAQFGLVVQPCTAVELVTSTPNGQLSQSLTHAVDDERILVTVTEPEAMLRQIAAALRITELDAHAIREVLQRMQEQETNAFRFRLRDAADDLERLALAVGEDALRAAIPGVALEAVRERLGGELSARDLAELAVAVHGYSILQHCASDLEGNGLTPPTVWAGRTPARRFVTDLGFAPEWAGYPSDSARDATVQVDGPSRPGDLHPYQRIVVDRIRAMISGAGPSRGFVSLPTGAGKTRVAVQAVIESAVEDGGRSGTVVWVAQSDELCEQAVQTWAGLWRALGPAEPLVISRFWSGNDVVEEPDRLQVVVATPEKLASVMHRGDLDWLRAADLVIVDEAHTSIAAEYTRVLEWLGRRSRTRAERRLLIGLSATPYRNLNTEETERLAARYDRNRLDDGAFGEATPHEALQSMGVLARVDHSLITGIDIAMSADELERLDKFKILPGQVERRIGDNVERNLRIVEHVAELPDSWTALLFATSVENAKALAALLTYRGIPARSVSASTPPSQRRAYVERFRAGEIRVLTNYNVLAQGFDAPAVRAVYVTRPTYSRNLYQQMIGRGLRGPLNGGSEEVMVVNVADNVEQYGGRLAFYDFEYLWTPEPVRSGL